MRDPAGAGAGLTHRTRTGTAGIATTILKAAQAPLRPHISDTETCGVEQPGLVPLRFLRMLQEVFAVVVFMIAVSKRWAGQYHMTHYAELKMPSSCRSRTPLSILAENDTVMIIIVLIMLQNGDSPTCNTFSKLASCGRMGVRLLRVRGRARVEQSQTEMGTKDSAPFDLMSEDEFVIFTPPPSLTTSLMDTV